MEDGKPDRHGRMDGGAGGEQRGKFHTAQRERNKLEMNKDSWILPIFSRLLTDRLLDAASPHFHVMFLCYFGSAGDVVEENKCLFLFFFSSPICFKSFVALMDPEVPHNPRQSFKKYINFSL